MEIQETFLQKSYKLGTSAQSYTAEFTDADKQCDRLEVYLVYGKSDQHKTTCNSYNVEVASKNIQKVTIENTSNTYSIANKLKYDVDDAARKHMLNKQFFTWCFNVCSKAPLTDYFSSWQQKASIFFSADKKI